MRYIILFQLIFMSALSSFADNSVINQLCLVNAEWIKQRDGLQLSTSVDVRTNRTFDDWIAIHLNLVERTLRERKTEHLSAIQKQNRNKRLDELNNYWHLRAFPRNDYLNYKNPVFIDRHGNHCAVGYLMQQSGSESLAKAIDADNKFIYVREIKTPGVSEWANENGFNLDELAWIQPGYPPVFTTQDLSGGLNGTVNSMVIDSLHQIVYAGGAFTASTRGASCYGVAAYISGFTGWDWIGLGSGLNGNVNALLLHNNKLYVGGEFTMAGSAPALHIAVYDLQTNQWQAMGSLDSAINSLAVYNNEIYAGGKFTGYLSKWTGSQWQDVAQGFLYGESVRTLEVWNNLLVIGGNFELATAALRKHVATYDGTYMGMLGFGTKTPVNDFEIHNGFLYAACDVALGTDTCALARYANFDWSTVLVPFSSLMNSFDGSSIQHLLSVNQRLFCGGYFNCASALTYGNNLMEFLQDTSGQVSCIPLLMLDNGIQCLAGWNNSLCFGGEFISAMGDTLNHVGLIPNLLSLGITGLNYVASTMLYPNPASDRINIHFSHSEALKIHRLKMFDISGQLIFQKEINQQYSFMELPTFLSRGVYFVHLSNEQGDLISINKLVLQ